MNRIEPITDIALGGGGGGEWMEGGGGIFVVMYNMYGV